MRHLVLRMRLLLLLVVDDFGIFLRSSNTGMNTQTRVFVVQSTPANPVHVRGGPSGRKNLLRTDREGVKVSTHIKELYVRSMYVYTAAVRQEPWIV